VKNDWNRGSVDINIRVAQPAEIETIISLQSLALAGLADRYRRYHAWQVDSLVKGQASARRYDVQSETIVVAEDYEQRLLGFICLCNSEAKIQGIFVHPDFMGLGIGARLLVEIEQLAQQRRFRQIEVMSSIEAIRFYERNGYISQGNTGFFTDDDIWIPCQVLRKNLGYSPKRRQLIDEGFRFMATTVVTGLVLVVVKSLYK
jgi:putative acetyltransferase